jgi:protein SCO1
MKPFAAGLILLLAATFHASAAQDYAVTGMVVSVDRPHRTLVVSIQAIPDYMPAMTMPFEVGEPAALDGLVPGTVVAFTLHVDERTSRAEHIRIVRFENIQQDPFSASRLKLLKDLAAGTQAAKALRVGEVVPEFRLIDQTGQPVALSGLRGRVVVVNFIYTSCVLPNFCLRLANNFAVLQKRFRQQIGRELALLTVTFDPVHDTPQVLAKYATQWNADPAGWRFLTGPPADVQRVCEWFGVYAFRNEGLMDHSLHTAVIDRQGRLVANVEGNEFTAAQLGDLTARVLKIAR